MSADVATGVVVEYQRFSVHDGPGIRTLVFLKGCSLRCHWCSNPETQLPRPQLGYTPSRCIGCLSCVAVCPTGAITVVDGRPATDFGRCRLHGACVDACPSGARTILGQRVPVEEVLGAIERDRPFYEHTGGGVTVSGGEPAEQAPFVAELLRRCKELGLHTAVETCLNAPWPELDRFLPYTDTVLMDIKHMDPAVHRQFTGQTNELILENARRIGCQERDAIVRTPVIPGFNDDPGSLAAIAAFAAGLPAAMEWHLLPYHRFGVSKYERIGRKYPYGDAPAVFKDEVNRLLEHVPAHGLRVKIGG